MDAKITDIVGRMNGRQGPNLVTIQTYDLAQVMALLAEQQAQAAAKLERQSDKIITLTWALCWLTVALLITSVVALAVVLK